jgi:hypothetical protein
MCCEDDFGLALAIAAQCPVKDDDHLARSLVYVAHYHNKVQNMIENFLSVELQGSLIAFFKHLLNVMLLGFIQM